MDVHGDKPSACTYVLNKAVIERAINGSRGLGVTLGFRTRNASHFDDFGGKFVFWCWYSAWLNGGFCVCDFFRFEKFALEFFYVSIRFSILIGLVLKLDCLWFGQLIDGLPFF